MYRIAILSDIHGNLPALHSVFNDLEEQRPDAVYCLGDLVDFAPWPNEVIDCLIQEKIQTVMGNHDERIAFDLPLEPLTKHDPAERAARNEAIRWTKRKISDENRKYLAGLPASIRLDFTAARLLMVHASPRRNDEYIYENHDEQDLHQMLDEAKADVLIMGHTHIPYVRTLSNGRMVLNVGSVGRSKEARITAAYLMLTVTSDRVTPEIRRIDYPVGVTAFGIRQSGIPEFYAELLRQGMGW